MIRALGASYRYPGEGQVVAPVDLAIHASDVTALFGPNGSGKTTLGKLLAGILKPTSGRVEILGEDTRTLSLGRIGQRLGYLFQEPDRQIFTARVDEELALAQRLRGVPEDDVLGRVEEMLDRFRLEHLREAFPFDLSRGEKQRLALAAIMINRPPFLVLDEPTTALDVVRKAELSALLSQATEGGVGMLIISHDRSFVARHATRILELSRGEIVDDYSVR